MQQPGPTVESQFKSTLHVAGLGEITELRPRSGYAKNRVGPRSGSTYPRITSDRLDRMVTHDRKESRYQTRNATSVVIVNIECADPLDRA